MEATKNTCSFREFMYLCSRLICMKAGILDLGTNTFNILIAEVEGDQHRLLYRNKTSVKLGEGAINDHFIADIPMGRGVQALQVYKEILDRENISQVYAFATAAIRSAKNQDVFIRRAREEAGIDVQVITGEREAELICKGVRLAGCLNKRPALIIDIGGGSVEFIVADQSRLYWKRSINIGVARILEGYRHSDPLKPEEIERIAYLIRQNIQEVTRISKELKIRTLVGSSGSFESFVEMIAGYKDVGINMSLPSHKIELADFAALHLRLLKTNLEQRLQLKGLIPMRADMIVLASVMTSVVIEETGVTELLYSDYSLKEGALFEMLDHS
ncbi:MAG: exopolyphosphatase [Bacteroidetes bacterium]|nr:exopolyphosphatase [Bacteroidota bacterium]MBU1720305.1 exopolyphosphatase [Bacteroidota bacterium]